MRPELIVAGKEFRDHITSKRFLVIFAVLMLVAVISMAGGMSQYNESLDNYKKQNAENAQQDWYKEQVASSRSRSPTPRRMVCRRKRSLRSSTSLITSSILRCRPFSTCS